jgi:hypothetical protein
MGMLFELIIYPMSNVDRGWANTLLWPALLIGLGIWLLSRNRHAAEVRALPAQASSTDHGDTPPPSPKAKPNGNGKVSPIVGFEPIDPAKGKK